MRLKILRTGKEDRIMAKNQRKLSRANHGKRPASSKARKLKRSKLKF